MKIAKLATVLAFAVSTSALAQDTRSAELAASDRNLNKTYSSLIRRLAPQDQVGLRAAQRAWIVFRDLDCKVGWADNRDCLIARTDERELQLRESVYWDKSGSQIELAEP